MIDKKVSNYEYDNRNGNEQYTPKYAVEFLLPYIKHLKSKIIWCPFDTDESWFVKVLKENDYNVVYSHLKDGQDFFTYEPKEWDVMISNPPYGNKTKFVERALNFNKPFTLLLPLTWLNDATPNVLFKEDLQLLIPVQRTNFMLDGENIKKKPPFKAVYYGYKIFEKDLIILQKEDMKK